jgi:hypothetical protein
MIKSFSADQSGSIAVQFGLTAAMLLMFGGGVIDYTLIAKARDELQIVSNTAALRLAALPLEDRGAAAAGLVSHALDRSNAHVEISDDGSRITIKARRAVVPAFMRLAGIAEFDVTTRSVAESVSTDTEPFPPGSGGSEKLTLCILALDEFDAGTVKFGGSTTFKAPNCVVQANSKTPASNFPMRVRLVE